MAFRFAFVVHPLSREDYLRVKGFSWTKFCPEFALNLAIPHIGPRVLGNLSTTSAGTGEKVEGILLGIPETAQMLLRLPPERIYQKLEYLGRYAERWGARIMGLGAYTSVVGDGGVSLARKLHIGLTNGNVLTSYILFQQAQHILALLGKEPSESHVAVVGATGSVGSALSFLLAQSGVHLLLVSRSTHRLAELREKIAPLSSFPPLTFTTTQPIPWNKADLILTCATTSTSPVPLEQCAPGTVVIDVGQPPNIPKRLSEKHPHLLVLQGGEVLWATPITSSFRLPLPDGHLYSCLAETLLLALEEWGSDFALGKDWNGTKLEKVREWVKKHQVHPAPFLSYGREVTHEDWEHFVKSKRRRDE
ncbi:MAG: hypothetical protein V2G33_07430 [bacterium JZ-2024 1]